MSLSGLNLAQIRSDFSIFSELFQQKQLVYFDNAATSQRPEPVIRAMVDFYHTKNANVHRGIHFLAELADAAYAEARVKVQGFVNAADLREIVFTRNATEALNMVVFGYMEKFLEAGDRVVLTEMEHHSNIVPWLMLREKKDIILEFVAVTKDGRLDMEDLDNKLTLMPEVVSLAHVSNVLGTINPVKEIIAMAHRVGAKVVLDACQAVPHLGVDVQDLGCDFLAFSGHKMCGPMGVGVLYAKREFLEKMDPLFFGGGMIKQVTKKGFEVAGLPEKFEAGTPNVDGAVGLAAAVDYLQKIDMAKIHDYEERLKRYFLDTIKALNFVRIVGPLDGKLRSCVFSFVMEGVHAHDVADFLNNEAICVRAGHHCAQPLMDRFGLVATVRVSLYFYNTIEEIDRFFEELVKCYHFFKKF